jgi:hypothetical protein
MRSILVKSLLGNPWKGDAIVLPCTVWVPVVVVVCFFRSICQIMIELFGEILMLPPLQQQM